MKTPDGKVVGKHDGLMYYTLGQRQGLKIGGSKESNGEPWFVAQKDMKNNVLIVVQGHEHALLLNDGLQAGQVHWISGEAPKTNWVYAAKTRYRQPDAPCEIERLGAVVYESNVCLGGGIITQAI
jgi:tRNA-uridine 2-sulfurtransferase